MTVVRDRLAGMRDYVGSDALLLRQLRASIEATFLRFAYGPVDPPVLESSTAFLDRSGEEIRRRMYVFQDPSGREICLRPELTIPICGLYLRHWDGSDRETRMSYVGPAFRYEPLGQGRFRQIWQAGIEMFAARQREEADAEVLAVALDALAGAGIAETEVVIGDLDVLRTFVDGLPLSDRWKMRLRRLAWNTTSLPTPPASALGAPATNSKRSDHLLALLASVGADKARQLVSEVLAFNDVPHIGGRTPEEIAERLVARALDADEGVSKEVVAGIAAMLQIRTEPALAFELIRRHALAFGVQGMDAVIERNARRLELLHAYREIQPSLVFDVGLRRGLAYYTSFVFEVYAAQAPQLGHLCGGGRYDRLLNDLGAGSEIPAVGFALGLDRVVTVLTRSRVTVPPPPSPDAVVVAAGNVQSEDCIRAATALRQAGWVVETDTSGRRPRSALAHALRRGVRYVLFVGEEEVKQGHVRLKRLADHTERSIPLADVTQHARAERLGQRLESFDAQG